MATLFDVWAGEDEGATFEDGWRNKLIWGDNKLVTASLLEKFSGKFDFIYIDPPFAVGSDFDIEIEVGEETLMKEISVIEEVAYRDTWGKGSDSFITMLADRIRLMRDLLSPNGIIAVHCDWRQNHHVHMLMDEIFGADCHLNEIIWHYDQGARGKNRFGRKHDNIYVYSKSKNFKFNTESILIPYESGMTEWRYTKGGQAGKQMPNGKVPSDVWDMKLNAMSKEHLGYPTQKPESLLERVVLAFTSPGDLVGDFFCGSGTTLAVAEKNGRRWIGSDLGRFSIHTVRKRMLSIEKCKYFEILNLGQYERQHWSDSEFGEDLDHGRARNSYVHVGSVSSPVTISEIEDALKECIALQGTALDVLGWEWEMGLIDTLTAFAKAKGVKLRAFQIPREIMESEAVRKGQIKFYELSYLEVEKMSSKTKGDIALMLVDFVIPSPELIPEDVRGRVKSWSDYVDYWAVDWDFQNDTFMPKWMDYRTKSDRNLKLKTVNHGYSQPGEYKIMVKVVDIFGNDTTKILTHKVQ
jgi:DNA modification methylase